MKKTLLALLLGSSLFALAHVELETTFKASFDPVILSSENPTALYTVGENLFKVILIEIAEEAGMQILQFEVYSIINNVEHLMSRPTFKKEKGSLATLTLGQNEYSMTLAIR